MHQFTTGWGSGSSPAKSYYKDPGKSLIGATFHPKIAILGFFGDFLREIIACNLDARCQAVKTGCISRNKPGVYRGGRGLRAIQHRRANPVELRADSLRESTKPVPRESYILLAEHCTQYARVMFHTDAAATPKGWRSVHLDRGVTNPASV
jgi:hypothetical protein